MAALYVPLRDSRNAPELSMNWRYEPLKSGRMSSEKGRAETRAQEKKTVGKTKRNPMRRGDGAADAKNIVRSWM